MMIELTGKFTSYPSGFGVHMVRRLQELERGRRQGRVVLGDHAQFGTNSCLSPT